MNDMPTAIADTPRNHAIAMHNHAVKMHEKGLAIGTADQATAYRLFSSSVDVDPTFKEGWYQLGNANGDLALGQAAIACFRRALEIDPNDAKALCNLGHRLYQQGRQDEAREVTLRAIDVEPTLPYAWSNLSLIQTACGQTEEAIASAEHAWSLEQDTVVELSLAFAYLYGRRWIKGLTHFESRFAYKIKTFLNMPYPRWHGEDFTGKTLYLTAEQGMGDALSYLRFVPLAAAFGGQVFLAVQPELVRMATLMLAGAAGASNVLVGPIHANLPPADYWCSLTSLPVALGMTDDEFEHMPGLTVPYNPIGATQQWKVPGRRLHVGIAWAGSPANEIDIFRSMRVTEFLELNRVPGIQLYGLQIGDHAGDIFAAGCQALIKDLSPFVRDVADTAAIVRDLDLIITVETSLGHIAGAVDAECWVLYSFNGGDYRIGRDERGALWYPRHKIFRQGPDGTWQPVWNRVVDALKRRVMV